MPIRRDAPQKAEAVLTELAARLPPTLYHYTSGEGLHGILRSGTLRGSNYAFMNDRTEYSYSATAFRRIVSAKRDASVHNQYDYYLRVLQQRTSSTAELYLSCFCEKPDLLSQWRGYGSPDARYCLAFRSADLTGVYHEVSAVAPVVYEEEQQRDLLLSILDAYLPPPLSRHESSWSDANDAPAREAYRFCAKLLPLFKMACFSEEAEWRVFLGIRSNEQPDELDFRSARGIMKPTLPLLRGSGNERLPLVRVIVGTTAFPDLAVKSAEMMLKRYGYHDVAVELSQVPLSG
jgi:hypothetical protein